MVENGRPFRVILATLALAAMTASPGAAASDEPSLPGEPWALLVFPFADLSGERVVNYLVWLPPEDDGGAPILEYRVYRTPFPSPEGGETFVGVSTTTSYEDSFTIGEDVIEGIFAYTVTAMNSVGEGPASAPSYAASPLSAPGPECVSIDGAGIPPSGVAIHPDCITPPNGVILCESIEWTLFKPNCEDE